MKGEGNQQDYGMRIYDQRVGRFLSVDPITKKYPELTPYQFASKGMEMVGRKYNSGSYRYGFNGKENDNEVKGEGAQYDYGFRIYDPRLGRFLSTDPLSLKYPWYTPYQFAGNKPIIAIDLDGAEEKIVISNFKDGKQVGSSKMITNAEEVHKYAAQAPKELNLIPNAGTLSIEHNKYTRILTENHDDYTYQASQNSLDISTAQVYTNWFSSKGSEFSNWLYKNAQSGGYGNDFSYTAIIGISGTKNNAQMTPISGDVKLKNTNKVYAISPSSVQFNNNTSLTVSVNSAVSINQNTINSKPGVSASSIKNGFENYSYFFFGSKTTNPKVGEISTEQTSSFKILGMKIETTSSVSGNFELKIGISTKPGIEIKSSEYKQKAVITSVSGSRKF